jgi:hypothetical protein
VTPTEFCEFFTNVGPDLAAKIPLSKKDPISSMKFAACESMFLTSPTTQEILTFLNQLDGSKAMGSDKVTALLVKEAAETIAPHLQFLFELSFRQGKVFATMKIAKITALHKAEDINVPSNYRPISVLSVLSKILERLMHVRLSKFFAKILTSKQYGFRKNRSTELALINFYQDLIRNMDEGLLGLGVFIDLKKAFDTVDHEILLKKLEKYGVCGPTLTWLTDYLSERKQFVKMSSKETSEMKPVRCGVPQGSILGPLLFIIYINDFPDILKFLDPTIFADDTTLMAYGKNIDELANK